MWVRKFGDVASESRPCEMPRALSAWNAGMGPTRCTVVALGCSLLWL